MVVVIRPFIFGEHMTVPASDRLSQLYTGNGVNTRFDFTFRVFDQEDATGIAVKVDLGTEFETMDESLYQVTINQDNLGGYVVFNTAPSNQTSFYIAGETPVDQALDITNYDNFYPDSIEKSLDKLTAILQEWSHLLGFEEQARKLSNIKYDESAQLRENQIKAELQDSINFIEQNTSAKLQEAIANGAVSALAITTVESESDLANLLTWDGRTVSVASIGNYKYSSSASKWERDFVTDRQVVTVESIVELLTLTKWEGRAVKVKSYNKAVNFALAVPYRGGKTFTYLSELNLINNGITIINGWCWLDCGNKFTTWDIGLTGDINLDNDATVKLQKILNVMFDDSSLDVFGDFKVSTNLRLKNISGVNISGTGSITGDKANWVFGEKLQSGTDPYGILILDTCPDSEISNIEIVGVQKNIFGSFQAGDAGIQLYNSPRSRIRNVRLHNFFAWGIISEQGDYVEATNNIVYNCAHQSGISLSHGESKHTKCNFNTIYNIGLYGVEIEDQTVFDASKYFEVIGNTVFGCTYGIVTTGNGLSRGIISGNFLIGNTCAIWNVNSNSSQNITVTLNTCLRNWKSHVIQSAKNVKSRSNGFLGRITQDTYFKKSPDHIILKLIDSKNFIMKKGVQTTLEVVHVNNIAITITAINDYVDTSGEFAIDNGNPIQLVKITIAESINNTFVNQILSDLRTQNAYSEAVTTIVGDSGGSEMYANTIGGGLYLLYCAVNPSSSENDISIFGNTFNEFSINVILHQTLTTHVKYRNNNYLYNNFGAINIPTSLIENGSFATKSIKYVSSNIAQNSGATNTIKFGHHLGDVFLGVMLYSSNYTISGTVQFAFNGIGYQSASYGTLATGAFVRYNSQLMKGINNAMIRDTSSSLSYTDMSFDVLAPS